MPYSHPSALALRDPPPVTVAFAHPAPDLLLARSLPVAGSGSQAQNRMRDGARSATLGHSRPFQAALWGVPGQLAAGWPRFRIIIRIRIDSKYKLTLASWYVGKDINHEHRSLLPPQSPPTPGLLRFQRAKDAQRRQR